MAWRDFYSVILKAVSAALILGVTSVRADTTSEFYLTDAFESGSIRGVISAISDTVRSASIPTSDRFVIKVGDDSRDRQIKSIISFDTSIIPPSAKIISATLFLTSTSGGGVNPIAPLQKIVLDLKGGYFGATPELESSDFSASGAVRGGSTTRGTGSIKIGIPPAALSAINKTGKVQIRLATRRKTNRDRKKNVVIFYSDGAPKISARPRLQVTYSGNALAAPTATPSSGPAQIWRPAPGTSWQWQLSGALDSSLDVEMYDIDLFDTKAETIAAFKSRGIKVVCYFSAGSHENYRPDSAQFPSSVLGKTLDGYPNERWLDVRQIALLAPVMTARMDLAVSKGCDGIEPDNVDGYANSSGFSLSAVDQLAYNRWLSSEAHKRNLSIGLKNDLAQVSDLVNDFDWALNEQCFQYKECSVLSAFVLQNKAVFGVEYRGNTTTFCPKANTMNFDWLKKNESLDAFRVSCR